jgi:hypothetical protein
MAVTVTSGPIGAFDPYTRDHSSFLQKLRYADGSAGTTAQRATAQAELEGRPDFKASFTTSDNAALANCMKLSGASSRGVTFPAATLRTIRMKLVSSNDADTYAQIVEQDVWGSDGTTPVLGDQRLVKAYMLDAGVYKQMGEVHLATSEAMAEVTDGTNSSGLAGGALSSSNSTFTFPPARAVQLIGALISQDTFAAATGGELRVSAVDEAAGTATLNQIAGDDGAAADAPAGSAHAHLVLWPPAQCALVLNSNDVEVHARTTLSDVFTHSLRVWIGKAEDNALGD